MIPKIIRCLKEFIGNILYRFRRFYNKKRPKAIKSSYYKNSIINVSNKNIRYIISSGITLEIKDNDKVFYFRECEEHLPLKKYVKKFIDFYFSYVYEYREFAVSDKEKICTSLKGKCNFKKFINMGSVYNPQSGCYKVFRNMHDPIIIGISDGEDKDFVFRIRYFIRYSYCKLTDYFNNKILFFNNKVHSANSCRNFAYQALAGLVGIADYIPFSEYCFVDIDGKEKLFGYVMENAGGVDPSKLSAVEIENKLTPQIQQQLVNLNLIDYLGDMKDHRAGNYYIVENEKGLFDKIRCFDNNEGFAFNKELFFGGNHGESCFVLKHFIINRPFLDCYIANRVLGIKKSDLINVLKKILRKQQINRIWQRLVYLKKSIKRTTAIRKNFLLKDNEWDSNTIKQELEGKYGKTYLTLLLNNNQ